MATSTETNKQSEEEPMISRDDIQFKREIITSLDMNMMLQAVKALDITSLGNLKAQIDSLWKEKSTTPEVLMPPVDKASHIPPSQGVETLNSKTETLCLQKSTTPEPALTEVFPDAEVAAANGFDKGKVLTYEDLQFLSNNFSPDNYMGRTHFGMLYKGFVPEGWKGMRSREATIKVWKNKEFVGEDDFIPACPLRVRSRMEKEIKFLQQPDVAMHPCTANVMGYCLEDDKLGVVYDLKPLQTLKKYIDNDNFGWLKRVNVAVKLAYLLKFFHENEPQYIVQNLSPAHVMLDQDLNPVLIDYATIHGGSFVGRWTNEIVLPAGSCGYIYSEELLIGPNTQRGDVHAYGVMLLEMLRRCRYDSIEVKRRGRKSGRITEFAWDDYIRHKVLQAKSGSAEFNYSFALKCFRNDPGYDALDGKKISLLALKCVGMLQPRIPTIGAVMKELKELKVVESHPELVLGDDD